MKINEQTDNSQRQIEKKHAEILGLNEKLSRAHRESQSLLVRLEKNLAEQKRVQEQMANSEVRYRRLFEAARDGILILDAVTCKIIDVNPFMVELLDYTREEFLGKELFEIGLLKDAAASQAMYAELQKTGYIRYDDLPLETKAGERVAVEFVSNVYPEDEHQVIQCNIRDITERKHAKEDTTRLAAIVESSDDAIISKTLDGIIVTWNAGAEKLYGYTAQEAIGRPVSFLAPSNLEDEMPHLLKKIRRGESVNHYETVRVRKDGSRLDISLSISPLRDPKGRIIGASSIKRDITERKQTEETLRESEIRYRSLFESNPQSMWVYDLETLGFLAVNDAAINHYGYTRDEFLAMTIKEIRPAEDIPALMAYISKPLPLNGKYGAVRHRKKDGTVIEVDLSTHELSFQERPARLALAQDVTERKQAEEALRKNEAKFRTIFETALDAILLTNDEGVYVDANPAACTLLGLEHGELMGRSVADFAPPANQDASRAAWTNFLRDGRQSGEFEFQLLNGTQRQAEYRAVAGLLPGLHMSILRDITERKQAEEELRDSEARKSAILETALDCVISMDEAGRVIEFNSAAEKTFGYKRDEAIGQLLSDLIIPPALREQHERGLAHFLATGEGPVLNSRIEVSAMRADGTEFMAELAISPVHLGKRTIFTGYLRDISERKQAEAALRHSEERYRSLAEAMPQIVWTAQPNGALDYYNQRWFDYTGMTFEQTQGWGWAPVIHPDDLQQCLVLWDEAVRIGQDYQVEYRFKRASDGTYRWHLGRAVPVRDDKGQIVKWVGTCTDISEHKNTEIALAERAQIAAVGAAVGSALVQQTSLQEILHLCAEVIVEHLGAAFARIWTISENGDVLELQASAGLYTHLDGPHSRVPVGQFKIGLIASERQPHLTNSVIGDPRVGDQDWARREGMVAFAGYPLIVGDHLVGVMAMFSRQELTELTLKGLGAVADEIALGIEHKQIGLALLRSRDQLETRVEERTAQLEQVNLALQKKETEQQRVMDTLALSEERFRLLVESVHDYAILMMDTTGHIMTWNAGAQRMKGYRAEEIIGQHFSCFYTEEDQQAGKPAQELLTAEAEGYLDDEGWRVRQDGSRFWATLVLTALRDESGQLRGFAKITRDITERKNIEAALREAKAQADAANQAKSEFLSRMSHELRTPLNAILGFGQLLAKQDFAPAQQERVQHILKAGRHLLDLINEVLEIARIEAGHMLLSLEPVQVRKVVQEVFSLVRPLAAEQDIELRGGDDRELEAYVWADLQRFKQVLLNLCSNAIKYNRPQGTITVTCQTIPGIPSPEDPTPGDQLRINVTDTGLGIALESQAELFTPFMRVGTAQTTIEGTGLGLALSLSLIHAMNGTIGVESTVDVGSTFWVQLPLSNAPLVAAEDALDHGDGLPDETPSSASVARYTLLYIEDNLSNLQLIEAIIADQPIYELISAMQGQMGLDLARQHHPDLILLDLHLPDVPGDQVLARLKADPSTADIPVVMLSAVAAESEINRLLEGGAMAYLTKPLDIALFLDTLNTILQPNTGSR